jgi:AraC-like DNA-binding protein
VIEQAETLAALAPDPHGKYFLGRTWLSFFATHGRLSGTIVWGEPSAADVRQWEACADMRLSPACAPHATLFDGHLIERFSPTAFSALARYASRSLGSLAQRITRVAVVHRGGFGGAVAAGYSKLVALPFPAEVFTDIREALRWLGCEDDAPLLEQLGRLHDEARAVPPMVRELASFLQRHPRATLSEAAHALALSTRSLQRRLTEHKTSFQRELEATRVRVAKHLLLDSEVSIAEVAEQVGLTSPQHLSALFRKVCRESPSEWRARARAVD